MYKRKAFVSLYFFVFVLTLICLKGHSQLMYMHIRYHFLADLLSQDARETESEKRIGNTPN